MNQKFRRVESQLGQTFRLQVHGSDQLPHPRILQGASLGRALQVLSAPLPVEGVRKRWLKNRGRSSGGKPFVQGWTHTHTHARPEGGPKILRSERKCMCVRERQKNEDMTGGRDGAKV